MSDRPSSGYNRRWYDHISNMTLAILASQRFPPDIQRLIAKNLNEVIDDCRKQQKDQKHAVSVGAHHRLLGLYKSRRRQRWYDPEPHMHRALNFMITVPESFLAEFAGRILQVDRYIEQQCELFTGYGNRPWLKHTVLDILQSNEVHLSESESGFRLVREQKHTILPESGNNPSSH
jgi:hypothetical protein